VIGVFSIKKATDAVHNSRILHGIGGLELSLEFGGFTMFHT